MKNFMFTLQMFQHLFGACAAPKYHSLYYNKIINGTDEETQKLSLISLSFYTSFWMVSD